MTLVEKESANWSRKSHKSAARRVIALSSYVPALKPPPSPLLLLLFILLLPFKHSGHTHSSSAFAPIQLIENTCNDQWNNGFPSRKSHLKELQIFSARQCDGRGDGGCYGPADWDHHGPAAQPAGEPDGSREGPAGQAGEEGGGEVLW